jgi:hypothetical protein
LGIHIGDKLLGTHPSQKKGHWEDIDFYELNMAILKAAGGNWQSPPTESRILSVEPRFRKRVGGLLQRKQQRKKFGWKDPRTCLTLPLYLPHLTSPRFILVYRETDSIVGSLLRRSGGTKQKWERLTRIYQESMEKYTMSYDILRVKFEYLVNTHLARTEVENINAFVEGNGRINQALGLIDFRI